MVKYTLKENQKLLLDNILKTSKIKNYLEEIDINNNFEKNLRNKLYNILLDKQINLLCEKCQESFE